MVRRDEGGGYDAVRRCAYLLFDRAVVVTDQHEPVVTAVVVVLVKRVLGRPIDRFAGILRLSGNDVGLVGRKMRVSGSPEGLFRLSRPMSRPMNRPNFELRSNSTITRMPSSGMSEPTFSAKSPITRTILSGAVLLYWNACEEDKKSKVSLSIAS